MDRSLYASLAHRASDLVEAGEHRQAIDVLQQLVDSELPDFDRAMMWLNIATVHDKMGNAPDALAAYDRALDLERGTDGYFIAQQHAAYLSQLGRYEDSIAAYRQLHAQTNVKQEDADVFLANIRTLEALAGR
jgi:tetratricopeptide (TPR) repeat protein